MMIHTQYDIALGGTIDSIAEASDTMGEPLGLVGTFTIRGLDTDDLDENGLPRIISPEQRNAKGRVIVLGKYAVHEFQLVLSPEMTPFHIMRRASAEYIRLHGETRWHYFFETMTINTDDRIIDLGMGS